MAERLDAFRGESSVWRTSSSSSSDTVSLGKVFGAILPRGSTVSLEGGLGSGKTYFIKGACAGLGIRSEVLSPSFILVEEYRGEFNVLHFDLYRLEELGEVYDTGFFDAADGRNIILAEWGDRLPEGSFNFDIRVMIDITGENSRDLSFHAPDNFIKLFRGGADGR